MGFYNKYILPKIINAGCGTKPIRKQREKVLPLCKGIVLEIGCGSGLNFSFYEENNIHKLYALEPNKEMLRQAESVVKEVSFPITFLETGAEKISLFSSDTKIQFTIGNSKISSKIVQKSFQKPSKNQ